MLKSTLRRTAEATIQFTLAKTTLHLPQYIKKVELKKKRLKIATKGYDKESSSKSEREKRAIFIESDMLNATSYCISPECLSLQLTVLEVRIRRLLSSLHSEQQGRIPGWPSTISWNLGNKHKISDRRNFED